MRSLINYLKQEGLMDTAKRAWAKAFSNGDSYTVFLRVEVPEGLSESSNEKFEILDSSNRDVFERMKFWDFVKTDDFIGNDSQSVVMLKDDGEYIAYAAEEHEIERKIHGLGTFSLRTGEGWIGPVYVRRRWRGHGYNRQLLLHQMYRLNLMSVSTIYTAINSQNTSSLKSFKSVGFDVVGTVDACGSIHDDPADILHEAFRKTEGL